MGDDERIFVDFYDILQVDPQCDGKMLEAAYHHLAKLYHPDHTGSDDSAKFNEVMQAYRALRTPGKRAKYDLLYAQHKPDRLRRRRASEPLEIDENMALDDADEHNRILIMLYKKRKESAQDAGVVGYYIQEMLRCSDEQFDFHKWYLKEKGYISTTEHGTIAITVQGVDHVISMSRTAQVEKLLIAQSDQMPD